MVFFIAKLTVYPSMKNYPFTDTLGDDFYLFYIDSGLPGVIVTAALAQVRRGKVLLQSKKKIFFKPFFSFALHHTRTFKVIATIGVRTLPRWIAKCEVGELRLDAHIYAFRGNKCHQTRHSFVYLRANFVEK